MPKPRQRKILGSIDLLPVKLNQAPLFELLEPRVLYSADALGVSAVFLPDDSIEADERYVDSGPLNLHLDGYEHLSEVESIGEYEESSQVTTLEPHELNAQPIEVVFIDSRVPDSDAFVDAWADTNVHFVMIEADEDGFDVISNTLQQLAKDNQDISTVKIVSHGASGLLQLGANDITESSLLDNASTLDSWSSSFTEDADILLFGCNVGEGEQGLSFVKTLAELTGTDVAASDDVTGNESAGGDWTLEVSYGATATFDAVQNPALADWTHTLATIQVSNVTDVAPSFFDLSTLTIDFLQNNFNAGEVTLRMAIAAANNTMGDDTIELTTHSDAYEIGDSAIAVNRTDFGDLIIQPATSGNVEITQDTAKGPTGFFTVGAGKLTIDGDPNGTGQTITIRNATSSEVGGAISAGNGTELDISNSVFTQNSSELGGGAIRGDTITVTDSVFTQNSSITRGGGAILGDTITVTDSVFTQNSSELGGGAIRGATITVTGSVFNLNESGSDGGAIRIQSPNTVTQSSITNSSFVENTSVLNGSAIFANTLTNSISTIDRVTFSGNEATVAGTVVSSGGGHINITSSTFADNRADMGASISTDLGFTVDLGSTVSVQSTVFFNNLLSDGRNENFIGPVESLGSNLFDIAGEEGLNDFVQLGMMLGPVTNALGTDVIVRPLLSGSLGINAGIASTTHSAQFDAQGLPIDGLPDIGASAFQGESDTIYWADDEGKIWRSNSAFTNQSLVIDTAEIGATGNSPHLINSLHVDLNGVPGNETGRLYWVDETSSILWVTNVDGSAISGNTEPVNLVDFGAQLRPNSTALDADRDLLFIASPTINAQQPAAIRVWHLTETSSTPHPNPNHTVIENPDLSGNYTMENPRDIFFSDVTGRIYWIDGSATTESTVHSSLADGSDYQLLHMADSIGDDFRGITLSADGKFLYFTNIDTQTVNRLNLNNLGLGATSSDPVIEGVADLAYLANTNELVVTNTQTNGVTIFGSNVDPDKHSTLGTTPLEVTVASTTDATLPSFLTQTLNFAEGGSPVEIGSTQLIINDPSGGDGSDLDFTLVNNLSDGGMLTINGGATTLMAGDTFTLNDTVEYINTDPGDTTIETFQLTLSSADGSFTTSVKTFYVNIELNDHSELNFDDITLNENTTTMDNSQPLFGIFSDLAAVGNPAYYEVTLDAPVVGTTVLINNTVVNVAGPSNVTFTHQDLVNNQALLSAQNTDPNASNDIPVELLIQAFDSGNNLIETDDPSNNGGPTVMTVTVQPVDDASVLTNNGSEAMTIATVNDNSIVKLNTVTNIEFNDEESVDPLFYQIVQPPNPNLIILAVGADAATAVPIITQPMTFTHDDLVNGRVWIDATEAIVASPTDNPTTTLSLIAVTDAMNPNSNSNIIEIEFEITPSNDAPVLTINPINGANNLDVDENINRPFFSGLFTVTDEEMDLPVTYVVQTTLDNNQFTLELKETDGTVTTLELGHTFTQEQLNTQKVQINATNANLTTPTFQDFITFTVLDDSPEQLESNPVTLSITIKEMNDDPTLTGPSTVPGQEDIFNTTITEGSPEHIFNTTEINFGDEETPEGVIFTINPTTGLGNTELTIAGSAYDQATNNTFTYAQLVAGDVRFNVVDDPNPFLTTPEIVSFDIVGTTTDTDPKTTDILIVNIDTRGVNDPAVLNIPTAGAELFENDSLTLNTTHFVIDDEENDDPIRYILGNNVAGTDYTLELAVPGEPVVTLTAGDSFTHDQLIANQVSINATGANLSAILNDVLSFTAVMSATETTNSADLSITINPANDRPVIQLGGFTLAEGNEQIFDSTHIKFTDEETPATGTYTISGVGVTAGVEVIVAGTSIGTNGTFTQQQLDDDDVVFNTASANIPEGADLTIEFNVSVNSGGQDSDPDQLFIVVQPVNEAPTFAIVPNEITIDEDDIFDLSDLIFDLDDEEDDTPIHYLVVSDLSTSPFTLEVEGNPTPLSESNIFTHEDLLAGNVSINTSSFNSETPFTQDIILWAVMDEGPRSPTTTLTVNIEPVNDAPTLTPTSITVTENSVVPINPLVLGYDDEEDNLATSYVIETLPTTAGVFVTLNDSQITAGQTILASDIGALAIDATNADSSAPTLTSLTLHAVSDDGQISTSESLSIQLNPENDSSTLTAQDDALIVNEGSAVELTSSTFIFTDEENANVVEYVIQSVPSQTGVIVESNGTPLTVGESFTQQELDNELVTINAENAPVLIDSTGFLSVIAIADDGTESPTATLVIDFIKVEDAPTLSIAPLPALLEGASFTISNDSFTFFDNDGDTLVEYRLESLLASSGFELQRDGVTMTIGDTFTSADLTQGLVSITSNGGNIPTSVVDQFSVTAVSSNGEVSNEAAALVLLRPVQDAPILNIPNPIEAFENTTTPLTEAMLSVTDQDGDAVAFYTVTSTLPAEVGTLLINGQIATIGDTFSQQDLEAGNVQLDLTQLDINQNTISEFELSVTTGTETSAAVMVPVSIVAVNDAPVLATPIAAPTLVTGESFTIPQNSFSDSDGDNITFTAVVDATGADGDQPLPDWLTFDPLTQSFTLNDDPTQELVVVRLIATDSNNAQTSTLVNLQFEPIIAAASPEPDFLEPQEEVIIETPQIQIIPEPEPVAPIVETAAPAAEPELEVESEDTDEPEEQLGDNGIFTTDIDASRVDLASLLPGLNRAGEDELSATSKQSTTTSSLAQLLGFTNDFNSIDSFSLSSYESTTYKRNLDDLANRWDRNEDVLSESYLNFDATVGSSVGISSGFTVGYMIWLLRGGTLMSSVLTSLPAWRMIDPLPVLSEMNEDDDADNESLESMVNKADQVAERAERAKNTESADSQDRI